MTRRLLQVAAVALLALVVMRPAAAQDLLADFEQKVTTFTLDNGLTFVVVERPEAPVVSMHTYADVGSVDEVKGITGIAHLFEHMAFKGTDTVGTLDIEAERAAIAAENAAFDALRKEQQKGALADAERITELTATLEAATEATKPFVEPNEFDQIVTRAGGTGLNASTSVDATRYFYSLPANKLELWFSLESDRFLNPVLREFFAEREVVKEERRMVTDSNPVGRLVEEFLSTAFKAHPYGEPIIGHMSDIATMTRAEALDFYRTYYVPSNLTVALVGAVDPDNAKRLAETYFGRLPAAPKPEAVETVEPAQIGERRVIIREQTQPFVLVGYHKGSMFSEDAAVFDMLASILGTGRTSRIYKSLVEEQQLALQAGAFNSFPGNKYPSLMAFFVVPNQGQAPEDVEAAIYAEIDRIKTEGVTEEELTRAKTIARANLVRQLGSNTGLASMMAMHQALYGDWREVFYSLDRLDAVTAADVQRVANETFRPNNRTVAMIVTETEETASVQSEQDAAGDTR
ncbi:MAG: pitrilysin family protein [Bacteroidota bacterium]